MKRSTFIVQVHPDGIKTLENLGTRERLSLRDLAEVGPQIERWLATDADAETEASGVSTGRAAQDRRRDPG